MSRRCHRRNGDRRLELERLQLGEDRIERLGPGKPIDRDAGRLLELPQCRRLVAEEHKSGAHEHGDALSEAVKAAVNFVRDRDDVVGVGEDVEIVARPVPDGRIERPREGGEQRRVGLEIRCCRNDLADPRCERASIEAAGRLDHAAAFEADAIAGLCVAEIRAPLVGGAGGVLRQRMEVVGLLSTLSEEMAQPMRLRYPEFVEPRQIRNDAAADNRRRPRTADRHQGLDCQRHLRFLP